MKRFGDGYLVAKVSLRLAHMLDEYVKAEEAAALANYWPVADFPKRPKQGRLSVNDRRLLDIQWQLEDPDGFDRYQRAKALLDLADHGPQQAPLVRAMTRRARRIESDERRFA